MTARVDTELVRRGLVRSRTQAQHLIADGRVTLEGAPVTRASTVAPEGAELGIAPADAPDVVSRAGHKLRGALEDLAGSRWGAPQIVGRRALDAGASTGGFTDVLLRYGAGHVVAVDVGTDQLDPRLRAEPRVTSLERTNVRTLTAAHVGQPPGVVVADLSFISLHHVLAPLVDVAADDADLLLMVKPQFEVGRARLGSKGVVRSERDRADAVAGVLRAASPLGLQPRALVTSRLPGPSGNVEYFVWFRPRSSHADRAVPTDPEALAAAVVAAGPGGDVVGRSEGSIP